MLPLSLLLLLPVQGVYNSWKS